jgi:hypothetical protein
MAENKNTDESKQTSNESNKFVKKTNLLSNIYKLYPKMKQAIPK